MKATFSITVVAPHDRVALSNMPVVNTQEVAEGIQYEYAKSPIMSTYLVAVVIGELDYVEEESRDGVLVRIYTQKGRAAQGQFALKVASRAVSFYRDFFGIGYPLPKMDMVAIPDFAMGAMENFGLITYRETRLLVDELNTSATSKQATSRTTCHEISHQWFGNLVTMQWWTHLWLNEGFARWAEHLAVDSMFPEWVSALR